jgi:ABC-type lipoprotein export system ATPase subunit
MAKKEADTIKDIKKSNVKASQTSTNAQDKFQVQSNSKFASEYIIELRNVRKTYAMGDSEIHALKDVSLKVKRGEFLSIVGKSGSGKSTLINQVGCLDTPTSGKVLLDGQDISELTESNLAQIRGQKIGFIFQTFNLMPTLSVWENIALPMNFQGRSDEDIQHNVQKVVELVQLTDRTDHKPGELSGGQRQRVAVARALANDPEVLLADEPTGNLDSKTGRQIMDFLLKLNQEHGVTIIMVTHDDDLAMWAERTVTLADGLIISEQKHSDAERKAAMRKTSEVVR